MVLAKWQAHCGVSRCAGSVSGVRVRVGVQMVRGC